MRAAAIAATLALGCGHAAAPAPVRDRLWDAAAFVSGDGTGHLPGAARALVATDGTHALAATSGGGLAEIDLARGEPVRAAFHVLDGDVAAMARAPDGRVLAVGAGAAERAWWIDPGRLTARAVLVDGATGGDSVRAASGVAIAPAGDAVVITGVRLPLALRDPRDLSIKRVLSPERNWTNPVFVGDTYLVAFRDGALVPFELGSGHLAVDHPWTTDTGFTSPDGLAILHAPDQAGLELTDLHNPSYSIALSSEDPLDVAWSADGQHVVVIDADRTVAYEVPDGDGQPIEVPPRGRAVFGTDGERLVITAAGALWRVDPATGRTEGPRGPSAGAIAFVAPREGGVVAIADRWRAIDRGGVRASGAWRGAGGPAFAASPDGARVAASSIAGGDAFVEAWDAATGDEQVSALVAGGVLAVDVDDHGAVTVATPAGVVRLLADRDEVVGPARWGAPIAIAGERAVYGRAGAFAVVALGAAPAPLITAAAFDCDARATATLSRDGARLAITIGDRVAVYDVARGVLVATARFPAAVRALALDEHGVLAATDATLVAWSPGEGATAIRTPSAITSIGLAASGDRIALGFADGRAGVWTRAALRALAEPTALVAAGVPPARCAGDPLAPPDDDSLGPRVQRLPAP